MTSDPAAVSAPGSNRIDVFARGNDNAVYRRTYDTVNGWQYWVRIGGNLGSGPGAASWAAGRLDVLALGQDGALYHTYSTDGGAAGGRLYAVPPRRARQSVAGGGCLASNASRSCCELVAMGTRRCPWPVPRGGRGEE